jgi:hypothetical protein
MRQRFWSRFSKSAKVHSKRYIAKAGLFTLAVTVVSYWFSYQDRIASRHGDAWTTLRAAIIWTQADPYRWGNVGQIPAIQTLTRDCNRWWRNTLLESLFEIFFQDCVELNSLSLTHMELGGLKAAGANLSYGNFACTNLATADLRRANLKGADFHGANLAGTDLRGAKLLESVDLRIANLSWARFDSDTEINFEKLKCACVVVELRPDGSEYRQVHQQESSTQEIFDAMHQLKACPLQRNTCEPYMMDEWKCAE